VKKRRWCRAINVVVALALALMMLPLFPQPAYAQAWLSGGWDQRVMLTIDSGDIDATLTWFPVMVYISGSSGINGEDVTFVFDEIANDNNRKKIAVTEDDGETELYVEIEKWDNGGEEAWLWVSRDGWEIASGTDTDIYLYYDADHADNDAHVADSGSRTEVWDSGYMAVHHFDGSAETELDDSTENDNDMTAEGGAPVYNSVGMIGNAVDFDGSSDYITMPDSTSLDIGTDALTLSFWMKPDFDETGSASQILDKMGSDNADAYRLFFLPTISNWRFRVGLGGTDQNFDTTGIDWTADEWHHMTATYDGSNVLIYWDAVEVYDAGGSITGTVDDDSGPVALGARSDGGAGYFDGTIDEARISNVGRLAEWIKARYESGRDHLLDWGSEEAPAPTVAGAVTDVAGETITIEFSKAMADPSGKHAEFGYCQDRPDGERNSHRLRRYRYRRLHIRHCRRR